MAWRRSGFRIGTDIDTVGSPESRHKSGSGCDLVGATVCNLGLVFVCSRNRSRTFGL